MPLDWDLRRSVYYERSKGSANYGIPSLLITRYDMLPITHAGRHRPDSELVATTLLVPSPVKLIRCHPAGLAAKSMMMECNMAGGARKRESRL